ncbi:TlpA family protein disulfide reductase [Calidithermus timidus]|jgi:cytochrome c biogenesis protein CcmG/thiol:disulfide interchange protein DsbE|uniref:TlpA family protein disulfide reductase n=1 Tax=Calidithermus timidus TaxID=307124 RepID=UPI0003796233|nr:TlpA disulfide reductase family protein [Calidithermus timidus]
MSTTRNWIQWSAAAAVLLALGLGLFLRNPNREGGVRLEGEVQNFSGERFDLARFRGQPVVVNAWATWCGPCRRELPMLLEQAKAHREIRFVFLNQGEGPEAVRAYLEEARLDMPEAYFDPNSGVIQRWGAQGLPTTYFFDAAGKLVAKHVGELNKEQLLGYLSLL